MEPPASSAPGSFKPGWAPAPDELQPSFPGLEIGELLGAGGMGAVFKARQPRLNRVVALKVLSCPADRSADFALRFEREAQVMARLDHPNIVTIHDFGEVDGTTLGLPRLFYLLMEHVDGMDLRRLIRSGDLHVEGVLALVPQICSALQYAHDEGIAHRDIKPANILVDRKGRVKIADFGLAKLMRGDETLAMGLTLTGTAMGTPHYMAPEQWEAPEIVDHRADIYSLGVVLYELLTGERPVGAFGPPSGKCRVDPKVDAIVLKAMEGDPARRFQQISELSTAFAEVTAAPAKLAAKRRPLLWAAVGLVALAGIGGLNWNRGARERGEEVSPESPAALFAGSDSSGGGETAGALPAATRERPFENSLGMKFVPVPGTKVLFCIHETRWRDYAAYAEENPGIDSKWRRQTADDYAVTDQAEDHPVWRMSWEDAKAFCQWLSEKEGRTYRLPTDEEWSVAVDFGGKERRSPDDTPESLHRKVEGEFPWGTEWPPPPGAGNYSDQSRKEKAPSFREIDGHLEHYDDGFPTTAPVMSFAPNRFGLHDMGGNVWEWVEDWYSRENKTRALRGGSWTIHAQHSLFSSSRIHYTPDYRGHDDGFRVVLEASGEALPPAAIAEPAAAPPAPAPPQLAQTTSDPAPASKEQPFENSLGMKFVPVAGTEVLFCIHETRWKDYAVYAAENSGINGEWKDQTIDGYEITERAGEHPVTRVGWEDAKAFCQWLSKREGPTYRLPTDEEWSVAVGLDEAREPGDTPQSVLKDLTKFPWGTAWPPPAGAGNFGDLSRRERAPGSLPAVTYTYIEEYDDGFPTTAPVMSFPPNRFGLHDMGGNVMEWVEDWYSVEQTRRTLRGGACGSAKLDDLRSGWRIHHLPGDRHYYCGFRVVVDLTGSEAGAGKI